jgi:Ca-activated chloride channel family protein
MVSRKTLAIVVGIGIAIVVLALVVGAFVLEIGDQQETAPSTSFGSGGSSAGGDQRVGLSAGGAQDANDFRTNLRNDELPQPDSLTYEGLYHDYYFRTSPNRDCRRLFCPSYSRAVSNDPLSGATDRYLAVGLNSGLRQSQLDRKPLDVVVVVDTSGSMDHGFDQYYYDGGERTESARRKKMAAAKDALRSMTDQLRPGDRVGVVSFSNGAKTVVPMQAVGGNEDRIHRGVRKLRPTGGTNLAAGMRRARSMLDPYAGTPNRNARIIYVTDAMPNRGETHSFDLRSRLDRHQRAGIHSTFVGVGVDFNPDLVERITEVRGANYYAVHSAARFRERMADGFRNMVTPLVYDLSLSIQGDGYRIANAYGVPTADDGRPATDELIHVNTLFPSRREGGKTEGGVILLELERTGPDPRVTLAASYERRDGERRTTERTVTFRNRAPPYYETTGVRKAVALTRYATLMRNWMAYERAGGADVSSQASIERRDLGQWEQSSMSLQVSSPYDRRFARFSEYFTRQQRILRDDRMDKDRRLLERLTRQSGSRRLQRRDRRGVDGRSHASAPDHTAILSHAGGDSLDAARVSIRVDGARGVGYNTSAGTTTALWQPRLGSNEARQITAGDVATVHFAIQPDRYVGQQPTDDLISGRSVCGVSGWEHRAAGLSFDGAVPAATNCQLRSRRQVTASTARTLEPGDTVRVVWSAASGGKTQTLYRYTVR